MKKLGNSLRYFFSKADMLLLLLCVVTTAFGIVMVASATQHYGTNRYVIIQAAALLIGIVLYILLTLIDMEILSERRELLFLFNLIFIGLLFTPLGTSVSGNRSWLHIPGVPFNIQPAEICKITFILLIAKTMAVNQRTLSTPKTVIKLGLHLIFIFGLIIVSSKDAGVGLMFILIFFIMLWAGGVHWGWFLAGLGLLAVLGPLAWKSSLIGNYQKQRILMIFDPTIDPDGVDIRWHTNQSLLSLTGGGITGQGLFNGQRTQAGALSQQHTDFIFSVIGEELGIIGCTLVLVLLMAIIIRCVYVGVKSGSYMNRLICIGIAGMVGCQIIINVGMCVGLTPVIGLTLPFISYGGSSIITMYLAMGVVSSIRMHPAPDSSAHYIRPPYYNP